MKLFSRIWQHKFDFVGIYYCEFCDKKYKAKGYDDPNFFYNILPNVRCDNCNNKSDKSTSREEHLYPCQPLENSPTCGDAIVELRQNDN